MKLLVCISSFFFFTFVAGQAPLKVTLYYESYCPGCQQFTKRQLLKVWDEFHGKITVDLIPYGNALRNFVDGRWEIDCQHGPKECVGNKLHACAIYQACNGQETSNCAPASVTSVLKYITCVEANRDQLQASNRCAKMSELNGSLITACAKGKLGSTLLNYYGNRTEECEDLKHVPWVTINDEHNADAENDLRQVICRLQPSLCGGQRQINEGQIAQIPLSTCEAPNTK